MYFDSEGNYIVESLIILFTDMTGGEITVC